VVEGPDSGWELADEWLPGGDVFRLWTPVRPSDEVKVFIDGKLAATSLYK